jgi:uncharacterized protein VirK/YbjX
MGRIAWAVLSNIQRQIEVFRLLASPALQGLVALDSQLPFKYLSSLYPVRGLTVEQRAEYFMHHYRRLQATFPPSLLRRILQRDFTLYQLREGGKLYTVVLGFPRKAFWEGEVDLRLEVDGTPLCILGFTIAPGWMIGSQAEDVLLILRVQGVKGRYEQIHSATKAFREVAPPALLLAALQGVAKTCSIREIAGICAASQFCYSERCSASFNLGYDDLFTRLGGVRATSDFYSIPFLHEDKSVDHVKNGHKSRTRKKRAFKLQVAEDVYFLLSQSCEAARNARGFNPDVVRIGRLTDSPALPPAPLH